MKREDGDGALHDSVRVHVRSLDRASTAGAAARNGIFRNNPDLVGVQLLKVNLSATAQRSPEQSLRRGGAADSRSQLVLELPIFLQSCCDVRFIETRRIRLAAPIKLGNPSLGAGAGARPGIGACLARRGHWRIGGSRRGGDGMGGKRAASVAVRRARRRTAL